MKYTNEDMIEDLRRVAALIGGPITVVLYKRHGRISSDAVIARFGTWLLALERAGLASPYKFGGIWFICPLCGASFRSKRGRKDRKYCSPPCSKEAMRRKANYMGRLASPQAARGRAYSRVQKRECETCGHDGSERRLEVHHVDKNPYNNLLSNLVVLCSTCHGRKHRGPRRKRPSSAESAAT